MAPPWPSISLFSRNIHQIYWGTSSILITIDSVDTSPQSIRSHKFGWRRRLQDLWDWTFQHSEITSPCFLRRRETNILSDYISVYICRPVDLSTGAWVTHVERVRLNVGAVFGPTPVLLLFLHNDTEQGHIIKLSFPKQHPSLEFTNNTSFFSSLLSNSP